MKHCPVFKGIAVILMLLCVISAAFFSIPVRAESSKTVRLGYFLEAGMMNGASEGEAKSGFVYEYLQELAIIEGWKYEYVYGSFSDLYKQLLDGDIDMLPYITKMESREKEVLFPDMPMGEEQFYLASMTSGRLSASLSELNGKKVGTTRDAFHVLPFENLLKLKGVSCQIVPLNGPADRWRALEAGEIDYSLESSTVFPGIDIHSVYELNEKYPYYLVVSKDRPDILKDLNRAQRLLDEDFPGLVESIRHRYFKGIPMYSEISEEGRAWLEEHGSITIGTYDKDEPYVILHEDGTVSGIAPDYIDIMLQSLKLDIPVSWKFYDGKQSALKALNEGEIDVINPYYRNYNDAETEGVVISNEVYDSDMSILFIGDYNENTMSVVATPNTRLGASFVRDNFPMSRIIPCSNGYDCLERLKNGEATSVILYTDALYQIVSNMRGDYNIKSLNAKCPVCFAALPENAALISVLNKAAPFISDVEMNAIQDRYSAKNSVDVSPLDFFVMHPEYIYGAIAFVLAIALFIVAIGRKRDKLLSAKQKQNDVLQGIIDRFTETYEAVFIGNLDDGTYNIIANKAEIKAFLSGINTVAEAVDRFILNTVHPIDRERVNSDLIAIKDIKNKLPIGEYHSLELRSNLTGKYRWYRSTAYRLGENELLIGVVDCDEEIMAKRIDDKLLNEYDSIYIVNLDRNEVRPAKASTVSQIFAFSGVSEYTRTVMRFSEIVAPEYRSDWQSFADPAYMKKYMAKDDHREYVYELPGIQKVMRRFTIDVMDRVNGEASVLLYSFVGIDDMRAKAMLMQKQMLQQKILLDYFVDSFASAYYVNLANDTFEILHMSRESLSSFGKYGDGIEGMKKFIELHVHPEDKEMMLKIIGKDYVKKRLADELSFTFTVREIFDNVERTMRGLVIRVDDEDHICVGFMDISEDIRREMQAKTRLEEALTFTNFFLDTFVSAYYVDLVNFECQTYKRSESLEEAYPITDNYFTSLTDYIEKSVHPDDREELISVSKPETMKAILRQQPEYNHTFRDISDGVEKFYKMQVIRGTDENHAAFGFIDITEELKEQKEKEQQLQEALAMAQSASKAKTTFLNNMSHDIRTPMNAIIGFTQLASGHIDNKEQVQDYLTKIGQSSDHLLSLINDVLDMSRIESGKMNLCEKPENLRQIIQTLNNIVMADVKAKKHSFSIEMTDIKDEYVVCDRLRLNQVLLNILSNSIKYTRDGGNISMRVTEPEVKPSGYATYQFCITDNGMGMDAEYLKTIFDPFTRVKSRTVSGIQGTGLGMAITKNIIEMMGGEIEVESELEKGTVMTVTFDFKLAKEEDIEKSQGLPGFFEPSTKADDGKAKDEGDFRGKRILLVEDNELNREIATEILVENGFVLDTAEDGDVAIEKVKNAKKGDYDIILMDVQMPRVDGYEATKRIRELGTEISKIPIIAMTANAFEEDRVTALEAGMDEHIAKPIRVDILKDILKKFV